MAKNFSREFADKLLDKLSSDDKFRERFQSDARAAVAELGYETPAADVGLEGSDPLLCMSSGTALASKEDIKASRAKLREQLSGVPFHYAVTL